MTANERMASVVNRLGGMPVVGSLLRRVTHLYAEGSVVTIRTGAAAGIRWRRHHRFVNGYWIGNYELSLQQCLTRLLSPGDVFYDVGAHAGFFSILAARLVGPPGAVYAFEPLAGNRASIEEQIALNRFGHCVIVPAAVGAEAGPGLLSYSAALNSMGHLGAAREEDLAFQQTAVEVVTLDGFEAGHRPPDVIKIDVEGLAHAVLLGGASLLRTYRPALVIELHSADEGRGVGELLRDLGYVLEDLDAGARSPRGLHHAQAHHPGAKQPAAARA